MTQRPTLMTVSAPSMPETFNPRSSTAGMIPVSRTNDRKSSSFMVMRAAAWEIKTSTKKKKKQGEKKNRRKKKRRKEEEKKKKQKRPAPPAARRPETASPFRSDFPPPAHDHEG